MIWSIFILYAIIVSILLWFIISKINKKEEDLFSFEDTYQIFCEKITSNNYRLHSFLVKASNPDEAISRLKETSRFNQENMNIIKCVKIRRVN